MEAEEILKKLAAQKAAYDETYAKAREALSWRTSLTDELDPGTPAPPVSPAGRRSTITFAEPIFRKPSELLDNPENVASLFQQSSTLSDDSDVEEDETYYVREPLPPQSHDQEELRQHLRQHAWDKFGKEVISPVTSDLNRLKRASLFENQDGAEDKDAHYQAYLVGANGKPRVVELSDHGKGISKTEAIWNAMRTVNGRDAQADPAVGRITIVREPSPMLFGALHCTMNADIDIDELLKHLVESEATSANVHRAFSDQPRRQRSFVFNFEYYTIIGNERKPMAWQMASKQSKHTENHIPISRCSSVVALTLYGDPLKKVRNPARRARTKHGYVHDVWSPWQVLNIQCYPDWKSTIESHDSARVFVNGPEAFMHTLLAEYRDAQMRFEEIYKRVSKHITPPADFIFNDDERDKRLFEDTEFTFTRRYFWAHQLLGAVNDSIKAMVDAYEDTFTEEVWEGEHKTLWPLFDESPRNEYFKRRMRSLQRKFEHEIRGLRTLIRENNERRTEILALRDTLFSGTSVQESRRSVELSQITIQQGHNIKLLTLVNIFFLPMTFVTSIFGMENIPGGLNLVVFGIVMATVCVPFFLLVGSLNSTRGLTFWKNRWKSVWHASTAFVKWSLGIKQRMAPGLKRSNTAGSGTSSGWRMERTASANEAMRERRLGFAPREAPTSRAADGEAKINEDAERVGKREMTTIPALVRATTVLHAPEPKVPRGRTFSAFDKWTSTGTRGPKTRSTEV